MLALLAVATDTISTKACGTPRPDPEPTPTPTTPSGDIFVTEDGVRFRVEIVATNLLQGNHRKTHYPAVPSAVFTIPPLAAVGLLEAHARARGLRVRINHQNTADWYSSRRIAEPYAGFKVLVEEGSGRILGAHLFGHHAEETINLFALAIQFGLQARDVTKMMFAYPTHSSDIWYMV